MGSGFQVSKAPQVQSPGRQLCHFPQFVQLTRVLNQLHQEGYCFVQAAIAALSPYLTCHINRFGLYHLDSERQPLQLNFELAMGKPIGDLVERHLD